MTGIAERIAEPEQFGRRPVVLSTQVLIFGGMFMGFGIKVPMFPFHTWLPDAHTQAPTRGLGDPGRRAPEARHLRLRPGRPADPPRGRRGVGAVDRPARGHRHHLRRPRLPRPDRHEAADRVLVGRPHGLRDARHRQPHRLRPQRRGVRHGRPRPHHRHALLPRRLGEGALPHPRDQAPRRPAPPGAEDGLDPRLLRDGVARPARPGRVLGRVPGDPRRPTTPAPGCPRRRSAPTW